MTTAPELPATSLAEDCYRSMFYGCTSLTTAPELSATTLADYGYCSMFEGCTSLTTAPILPATTLADYCYDSMFYGCVSLTVAYNLPATTLTDNCYYGIFKTCTSLNSIKIAYIGNYDSSYFNTWVDGVASSGTFYYNGNYNGNDTSANFGFPNGWTKTPF